VSAILVFPQSETRTKRVISVDLLPMTTALEAFDAHGLRAQNDRLLDVTDMASILGSLYILLPQGCMPGPLFVDLCLNWLLNVYDRSVVKNLFVIF
jgi:EF hand